MFSLASPQNQLKPHLASFPGSSQLFVAYTAAATGWISRGESCKSTLLQPCALICTHVSSNLQQKQGRILSGAWRILSIKFTSTLCIHYTCYYRTSNLQNRHDNSVLYTNIQRRKQWDKKVTCRNHYVRNITRTHYLLNMSSLSKSSGVGLFRNCITRHLSANWLKALSSWQLAHMESSFLSLRMTQVASTYGLSCFSWGLWWRCQD